MLGLHCVHDFIIIGQYFLRLIQVIPSYNVEFVDKELVIEGLVFRTKCENCMELLICGRKFVIDT